VIDFRHQQRSLGDGLIRETVDELWEDWMRQADAVLEDEALLDSVYEALQHRHPRSRTHGRRGTPAEVVLRMLLLKHIRDWSFAELEREVRANLLYREFTRIGAEKVPDAKTPGATGSGSGPGGHREDDYPTRLRLPARGRPAASSLPITHPPFRG
jgi:IS5 family transposase